VTATIISHTDWYGTARSECILPEHIGSGIGRDAEMVSGLVGWYGRSEPSTVAVAEPGCDNVSHALGQPTCYVVQPVVAVCWLVDEMEQWLYHTHRHMDERASLALLLHCMMSVLHHCNRSHHAYVCSPDMISLREVILVCGVICLVIGVWCGLMGT